MEPERTATEETVTAEIPMVATKETTAAITTATMATMAAITVETAMEIQTEPIPRSQMVRPMPQISLQRMETMCPVETKTTNTTRTTETTTGQIRQMVRM